MLTVPPPLDTVAAEAPHNASSRCRPPSWQRRRAAQERQALAALTAAAGAGEDGQAGGAAANPPASSSQGEDALWEQPATQLLCRSPMAVWDFDAYLGDEPLSEQLRSPPPPTLTQLAMVEEGEDVPQLETAAAAGPHRYPQGAGSGGAPGLVAHDTVTVPSGSRRGSAAMGVDEPDGGLRPTPGPPQQLAGGGAVQQHPRRRRCNKKKNKNGVAVAAAAVSTAAAAVQGAGAAVVQREDPRRTLPSPSRPAGWFPPSRLILPRTCVFYSSYHRHLTGLPSKCE